MKLNSEIVIDCDKMKAPNTGLHYFCLHLVNALQKKALSEKEAVSIFAPDRVHNLFDKNTPKISRQLWNIFRLHLPSQYKVWHATYQLGKYFPVSKQSVLLTIHDLNFLYEGKSNPHKYLKKIQKNIDRADKITAISEFTKKDILTHLNTHGKEVTVIYNGGQKYEGVLSRPKWIDGDRPFLFSLGTVLPKKNFHVLPCLLKGNDYNLIISGNLSPYSLQILNEAKQWGVENRIILSGPVKEEEKQWLLSNCSAFLFPSIAEGFGLPVVEAMYYGKPVFSSSRNSLPEIGGSVATFFNDEFEPDGMREEFSKGMELYSSGTITPEMIVQNASRFSWERTAEKYWQIYNTLR